MVLQQVHHIVNSALMATILIKIKSIEQDINEVMGWEWLKNDVMMAIQTMVMDVIIYEGLKRHGSDMMEMELKKIIEHYETRPLVGILTTIQLDLTLSITLSYGLQKI